MSLEIERKFIVNSDLYKSMSTSRHHIEQYYLSTDKSRTVRVRIIDDKHAYLTIKGVNIGVTRQEWEYEIPVDDAREMIGLCEGKGLSKWRYIVPWEGHTWEVDVFEGRLMGLVVAEVEIGAENEDVVLPPFVGEEVSGDKRYYNSVLSGIDA